MVIMRMLEPRPVGLTFLLAMMRATDLASFLNVPSGGKVETVLILCDHLRLPALFFFRGARFDLACVGMSGSRLRHFRDAETLLGKPAVAPRSSDTQHPGA